MTDEIPDYHFRIRENGATVFRVDAETRGRRIDMDRIATLNMRNGEVKPQGGRGLDAADRAAIDAWMAQRREVLAAREMDEIQRLVDDLGRAAHWAQGRARDDQIDAVSGPLLMAMHDLRSVLVRKRGERLQRDT